MRDKFTDRAREIYDEIYSFIESYEAIEEIDHYVVAMMAQTLDIHFTASEKIRGEDAVQVYKTGAEATSAWFQVFDKTIDKFQKLSVKLGMTPKDREAMEKFKAKKDEGDALDDL